MSYTYSISETLQKVNGNTYKMIEIVVEASVSEFYQKALWPVMRVVNGSNSVPSFNTIISGDNKSLIGFFTVDAFSGFSASSVLEFGYGENYNSQITGVNVLSVNTLPIELQTFPHLIADNNWLQTL